MLGLWPSGLHILLGGASDGFQPKRRLWNATPEVHAVWMLADVGCVLCVRKGRKQVVLGTAAWESLGCFESTQRFSADCMLGGMVLLQRQERAQDVSFVQT